MQVKNPDGTVSDYSMDEAEKMIEDGELATESIPKARRELMRMEKKGASKQQLRRAFGY